MHILEKQTLGAVTGVESDIHRVSELAYARLRHGYDETLLTAIEGKARKLARTHPEAQDSDRFLGLRHLREAQVHVPEIAELMHDSARLEALSELAGTRLAPYPISRAASHLNFYRPGEVPIHFHTDGAAMVELIPLHTSGSTQGGATLIYRGRADEGKDRLARGLDISAAESVRIPQPRGCSVLMQGRMLLHRAESFPDGERLTLVLVMEAAEEPWKDDNTLMRLLLDDPLDSVLEEWVTQAQRRLALYQARDRT
ncbi:hypothetical protein [Actinomadura roseirufa]|uniref:hypothetical protein n=1 Tax=Actinomadura roseirufa TaxID=2094049 RepID=UPI0010410B5C|nr:hypothetical protein [Actinomadura roseirufa]